MFDKFQSRLNLEGKVETLTAIRIGAGRSTAVVGSDLPVVRDTEGSPYIPGSSFKGVLRSYVESILRSIANHRHIVCNPANHDEHCITPDEMEDLREKRNNQNWDDQKFSTEILNKTCWACQLFGSLWYASKLQIRDLYVQPEFWFGQYLQRDGVAIDRDTETASDGKLYDYEVVPAGVLFNFQAIVDNAEDWQLGMLYLGLSAFEKGELTIGGGSSRGLGVIELSLETAAYIKSSNIMEYLTKKDHKGEDANWECWVKAFQDKLEGN